MNNVLYDFSFNPHYNPWKRIFFFHGDTEAQTKEMIFIKQHSQRPVASNDLPGL